MKTDLLVGEEKHREQILFPAYMRIKDKTSGVKDSGESCAKPVDEQGNLIEPKETQE